VLRSRPIWAVYWDAAATAPSGVKTFRRGVAFGDVESNKRKPSGAQTPERCAGDGCGEAVSFVVGMSHD
jgi:hypothetical protein